MLMLKENRKKRKRGNKKQKEGYSNKAIRYRLYPSKSQLIRIHKTIGCCRLLWNLMFHDKQEYYHETGKTLKPLPTDYKKLPEYDFLNEVDSLALCNVQMNLELAYSNYFQGLAKFPKYKSKKKSKASYTTNKVNNNIYITDTHIRLPIIGEVKATIHKKPNENWIIKSATVTEEKDGSVYVSVLFEYKDETKPMEKSEIKSAIGLDYKSDGFYVDSNGNTIGSPKYLRKAEERLARLSKKLSKKQEGSKNREKARKTKAKLDRHVSNQRKDFLHKLSTEIANQYDLVCVEDINLKAISNNEFHLGKSTNDNGYGMFRNMLAYKLKERGKYFIRVGKFFPSTQLCSNCGRKHKLTLSERTYKCECGLIIDRDINAAINILHEGIRTLQET